MIRIEPATPDDVPLILRLITALAEYERLSHQVVASEAALRDTLFAPSPAAEVVIAYVDDQPAGFALWFHNYSTFLAKPGLYLEDLFVRPEWRGRGVGKSIMRVLLEQARQLHLPTVSLHAQSHAIPLYESVGFRCEGEEFLECGIPHRTMRFDLDPPAPRMEPLLPPRPEARVLAVEDRLEARAALVELLADTRNEIALFTRDLDPGVLDAPEVLAQIKRIALSGRHARIRILLQDPRKAVTDGNRLVALAQRLPSAIEVRTPIEEQDQQYAAAYLVTDRRGYLYRTLASRHEAEGSTHAPGRHGQLLSLFDQVWERSVPSEELRQLQNL